MAEFVVQFFAFDLARGTAGPASRTGIQLREEGLLIGFASSGVGLGAIGWRVALFDSACGSLPSG
jgi:hypothetical protein